MESAAPSGIERIRFRELYFNTHLTEQIQERSYRKNHKSEEM